MIDRILAHFGYHRVALSTERFKASGDPVERGARWDAFYREEGGLADMLADIRREAFEAAAELDPAETDKIYYWATADRNIRKLDHRVQAIIHRGTIAAEQIKAQQAQPRIMRSIP